MRLFFSSYSKKILGGLVILLGSGIFLNGYVGLGDVAYAQENGAIGNISQPQPQEEQNDKMSLAETLNILLKTMYLLLWPLLVLAGLSLDNTLVYASIFHLDAPLWKFWNMMKNFANFTLGFMVLIAIIKSIITNSGQGSFKDEKSPLGVIKTTLIAGVLIQASWFLLAALVDVSTIATYAVGGLPLSILQNTEIGQQKILSINSSVDRDKFDVLNEEGESFKVRYSTTYHDTRTNSDIPVILSPCKVEDNFVIGREYTDATYRNPDVFGDEIRACVVGGNQIVLYNEFPSIAEKEGIAYKNGMNDMFWMGINTAHDWLLSCGYIIPLGSASATNTFYTSASQTQKSCGEYSSEIYQYIQSNDEVYTIEDYQRLQEGQIPTALPSADDQQLGQNGGSARFDSGAVKAMSISDLISKSKGFVGPLVTIYASLLNFAELTAADISPSIGQTSGIFIIKSLVAIGLFFPLVALAIVLITRIGILWLYIVGSPFIVLKATFSKFLEGTKMKFFNDYLSLTGVIKIVFAPVVSVAALSISLIFMTALINGFQSSATSDEVLSSLELTKIDATNGDDYDAIQVLDAGTVEFSKLPRGDNGLNWFSWLLVNFFAIGLMWMIFFAALKSNELGAKFGTKVQEFGENIFKTMPILPIGENGQKVGIGSAGKVLGNLPQRYIDKRETDQADIMEEKLAGMGIGKSKKASSESTNLTSEALVKTLTQDNLTKETIQKPFASAGDNNQTITDAMNTPSNVALLYDAWSKVDKTKQADVKQKILEAGVTQANWDEAIKQAQLDSSERALATYLGTPQDQAALNTLLEPADANNKQILKDYFANKDEYTITIGDKTFIITKSTTPDKYDSNVKP